MSKSILTESEGKFLILVKGKVIYLDLERNAQKKKKKMWKKE